jgi:hypothetical protein
MSAIEHIIHTLFTEEEENNSKRHQGTDTGVLLSYDNLTYSDDNQIGFTIKIKEHTTTKCQESKFWYEIYHQVFAERIEPGVMFECKVRSDNGKTGEDNEGDVDIFTEPKVDEDYCKTWRVDMYSKGDDGKYDVLAGGCSLKYDNCPNPDQYARKGPFLLSSVRIEEDFQGMGLSYLGFIVLRLHLDKVGALDYIYRNHEIYGIDEIGPYQKMSDQYASTQSKYCDKFGHYLPVVKLGTKHTITFGDDNAKHTTSECVSPEEEQEEEEEEDDEASDSEEDEEDNKYDDDDDDDLLYWNKRCDEKQFRQDFSVILNESLSLKMRKKIFGYSLNELDLFRINKQPYLDIITRKDESCYLYTRFKHRDFQKYSCMRVLPGIYGIYNDFNGDARECAISYTQGENEEDDETMLRIKKGAKGGVKLLLKGSSIHIQYDYEDEEMRMFSQLALVILGDSYLPYYTGLLNNSYAIRYSPL